MNYLKSCRDVTQLPSNALWGQIIYVENEVKMYLYCQTDPSARDIAKAVIKHGKLFEFDAVKIMGWVPLS